MNKSETTTADQIIGNDDARKMQVMSYRRREKSVTESQFAILSNAHPRCTIRWRGIQHMHFEHFVLFNRQVWSKGWNRK